MKEKMLSVQNSLIHRIIITFVSPIWDLKGENIRWTTVFHFNSIYFRSPYFKILKVLAKEWGAALALFQCLDRGDHVTSKKSLTSPSSILSNKPFLATGHGQRGRTSGPEYSPY